MRAAAVRCGRRMRPRSAHCWCCDRPASSSSTLHDPQAPLKGGSVSTTPLQRSAKVHSHREIRASDLPRISSGAVFDQREDLKKRRRAAEASVKRMDANAECTPAQQVTAQIKALGEQGRWKEVFALVDPSSGGEWQDRVAVIGVAMQALGKHGRTEEVLGLLQHVKSLGRGNAPNAFHYNQLIQAHATKGDPAGVMQVIDDMEARGIATSPYSFAIAIHSCRRDADVKAAQRILRRMRQSGHNSNTHAYSAAIDVCSRKGNADAALEILQDMRTHGPQPNMVTYGTAMNALAKTGRWQSALALFEEVKAAGLRPQRHMWSALLNALGRGGELVLMMDVFEQMKAAGEPPSVVVYTTLISAFAHKGDMERSLALWAELKEKGLTPNTVSYNALMKGLVVTRDPAGAAALLEEMAALPHAPPNVVSYNSVIMAYAVAGDVESALAWIERARAAPGVRLDVVSWNSVIHAVDAAGDAPRVRALYGAALASGAIDPYALQRRRAAAVADDPALAGRWDGGAALDLHGLNVAAAKAAVRWELEAALEKLKKGSHHTRLDIIAGNAVRRGKAIEETVKSAVTALVTEMGLTYTVPRTNLGRIIVQLPEGPAPPHAAKEARGARPPPQRAPASADEHTRTVVQRPELA